MCKFWGAQDQGYKQVGGELKDIINRLRIANRAEG
jgi:hypothetical protein